MIFLTTISQFITQWHTRNCDEGWMMQKVGVCDVNLIEMSEAFTNNF